MEEIPSLAHFSFTCFSKRRSGALGARSWMVVAVAVLVGGGSGFAARRLVEAAADCGVAANDD